ncbi:MAG: 50S ribosomal protein L6 [Candidatus Ratteibacteria bacterium]|nr:50S ribosomal protein L6 [Candidatus Ratteibacteria bacterium]
MSRIGKMPISIPNNVKVDIKANLVSVEGPKGKLSQGFSPLIGISKENEKIIVKRSSDEKQIRALHGTTRNLIANMIKGVSEGFQKELEIVGVGYSAKVESGKLIMKLGFSHPVEYVPPDSVKLEVKKTKTLDVTVSGPNKQDVGQAACEIRKCCPPNAYKGKGIRYKGEYVKLKPGKTAATGAPGAA